MLTARTLLILAGIALVAPGCSSSARPANGPLPRDVQTTVRVSNQNWSDMVVYALSNGLRVRLGTVTSMSTRRLAVPKHLLTASGEFRLAADPIGAPQGFVTQPIQVYPGSRIEFTIQNNLPISSYSVRNE